MAYHPVSHIRTKQVFLTSTGEGEIPVAGFVTLGSSGAIGSPGGGSTQVSIREFLTSSGASVMDSTESAVKVNVVAGSAGGSTLITVRQSTIGDLRVASYQSTAADLSANVVQGSTTWQTQCSTLGGAVIVRSSAADMLVTVSGALSSISTLAGRVMVDQNSTVWQGQVIVRDSSGTAFAGAVTRPTTGAQGLVVRHVLNDLQSTALSTLGNNSTSSTLVSSVASQRIKVYAYSITSTVEAVNSISFASSLANPIWTVQMRSLSSAITGVNLAVTPPAWLFATEAASPLVWKCGPSTGSYHVSVSWFTEA